MKNSEDKQQKIKSFNASGVGIANKQIFGFPFNYEDADLVIIPVPWEVTVSYRAGTAMAPSSILKASPQLDFYDHDYPDGWKRGIFMHKISQTLKKRNSEIRKKAARYIQLLEKNKPLASDDLLPEINEVCEKLHDFVYEQCSNILNDGKLAAVLGGDHSTPLGLIRALAEKHEEFGILQIDAHADLREAYEGFTYSHASAMFNALKIPQIKKLVQAGIRDISDDEITLIKNSERRIVAFYNDEMKAALYGGMNWNTICEKIISELPDKIYVSFDIDGLDRKLCPNSGTPVPGGFEIEQVYYLLNHAVNAGKKIIGFDLVEVSPGKNDWDGNVGARVLYKLCSLILKSNSTQ
jgi:agmatinase